MLRVLHSSASFLQSRLFYHLVGSIDRPNIKQAAFTYFRKGQSPSQLCSDHLFYEPVPSCIANHFYPHPECDLLDRIFFERKVSRSLKALSAAATNFSPDIVHAHYLFSDGFSAFHLCSKLKIPYIITVRNTDINFHYRYRPYLFKKVLQVLHNARYITFLNPSYRQRLIDLLPLQDKQLIEQKSFVIPNGLSSSWISKPLSKPTEQRSPCEPCKCYRLLYVGDFSRNKNLVRLIQAVHKLSDLLALKLSIAGGSRTEFLKTYRFLNTKILSHVQFLGRVSDRDKMQAIYKDHDIFVMPSLTESFGLVYLEALSQGLPVLCSTNEGISGFFNNSSHISFVNPRNIDDIASGILQLIIRLNRSDPTPLPDLLDFSWESVASSYVQLYTSSLGDYVSNASP